MQAVELQMTPSLLPYLEKYPSRADKTGHSVYLIPCIYLNYLAEVLFITLFARL